MSTHFSRQFKRFLAVTTLLILLLWGETAVFPNSAPVVFSQEPPPDLVEIIRVDDADFPLVKVDLRTSSAQGGQVDLSGASFRENGIPVEFALAAVPAGRDVVFVLDANETMLLDDNGDGLTRFDETAASINRFAQTMLRPGLDRVSILVPHEGLANGRFLVENADDPQVIAAALAAYEPPGVWPTPLQAMLVQAIDHAGEVEDNGRYQTVLLFTDASRIHLQLDYEALIQAAQAGGIPIFGAILGTQLIPDEQFRVERLTQPTRGVTIHMPNAAAADGIFAIWEQQSAWPQIQYNSLQTKSGQYPLALNFGQQRVTGTLDLTLLPPEVTVLPPSDPVVRRGTEPETPVVALEPKQVTIPVQLSWPDGKPRALTNLVWQVNGQRQPALNTINPDGSGQLQLAWNVELLDEGRYELVVDVADELGYTATSPIAAIDIVTERPLLPTPIPAPTATPLPEKTAVLPNDPLTWLGLIGALGITAVVLLLINWWRTRTPAQETAVDPDLSDLPALPPVSAPTPFTTYDAYLEPITGADLQPIHIDTANLIIGRDEAEAGLVLTDSSVARLHARITRQNGRYWLYDEGSAHGTYLNYIRLGLAPQLLTDNDVISIGRLQFRFVLRVHSDEPPEKETENNDE
ncbi:MAG: FHA domain-containing protein [Chloroflexota bacterium]